MTSAHVSELTSPGDWLHGGELLMTVGLLLPMQLPDCRAYVSECAAAGVAALALGLGHGLPYQDCPEALRIAAEESGVPLLMVPDETPFIAVTKWVFETIAKQERQDLQTAMEINRRLTAVATSSASAARAVVGVVGSERHPVRGLRQRRAPDGATPSTDADRRRAGLSDSVRSSRRREPSGWSMVGDFEVHTVGARFRWPTSCSAPTWT